MYCHVSVSGPGSYWLRAGHPRDRIPVGARFSAPLQTGPGVHPAFCTTGTGSFPVVKSGRGVKLTPHPLLVPWSRKSRAIRLLPLWAVRPVQSLSACTRVHFIFTFTTVVPVPVVARSKAWVCGRSSVEIVGSNPIGGMDVFYECCVLSLRRAYRSCRGVQPSVVRRCVWSRNLVKEEALAHWGAVASNIQQESTTVMQYNHSCTRRRVS